jgi:hypothetical protein
MRLRRIIAAAFLFSLMVPVFGQQQVGISGKSIVELRRETLKRVHGSLFSSSQFSVNHGLANAAAQNLERSQASRLTLLSCSEMTRLPSFSKQLSDSGKVGFPRLTTLLRKELTVPAVYSYHNLGMFCKFEVQLEHAVKFPVKLRLGEVQYVDRLEGKGDGTEW